MIRNRALVCFIVCIIAGCGGGSDSAQTGRAVFTIVWPPLYRLIPDASNSVKVELLQGGVFVAARVVSRPAGGGGATAAFEDLAPGAFTAVATAHPNADGTGIAQAAGSVGFSVQAGERTLFTVNMDSAVERIELIPSSVSLDIGQTHQLQVDGRNAANEIVLISPFKLEWLSTGIAHVSPTGVLSVSAIGTGEIRVTDLESGKSAAASVQGTFDYVKLNPETGRCYESVHYGAPITWTEAKRQAESRQYFSRRGHLLTVTTPAESEFVRQYVDVQQYWIGGYQDKNAPDYFEPFGGWRWITGEPMTFTDWNTGEPNDGFGLSNYLHFFPNSGARWNDTEENNQNITGYIVEYE